MAAPAAPPARAVRIGTGVMPAVVTGIVLAALVLAFVAQNTKRIELTWLWFDFRTTPGVLVLVALFLGVVASVIIGAIVRRNRRIRLNEPRSSPTSEPERFRRRGNPERRSRVVACDQESSDLRGPPCRSR